MNSDHIHTCCLSPAWTWHIQITPKSNVPVRVKSSIHWTINPGIPTYHMLSVSQAWVWCGCMLPTQFSVTKRPDYAAYDEAWENSPSSPYLPSLSKYNSRLLDTYSTINLVADCLPSPLVALCPMRRLPTMPIWRPSEDASSCLRQAATQPPSLEAWAAGLTSLQASTRSFRTACSTCDVYCMSTHCMVECIHVWPPASSRVCSVRPD